MEHGCCIGDILVAMGTEGNTRSVAWLTYVVLPVKISQLHLYSTLHFIDTTGMGRDLSRTEPPLLPQLPEELPAFQRRGRQEDPQLVGHFLAAELRSTAPFSRGHSGVPLVYK